jgi:hypothetical protein
MSPASSDASMLAVAVPAPLRPTLLAVHSCTRQHANLLVPGRIVSGLVYGVIQIIIILECTTTSAKTSLLGKVTTAELVLPQRPAFQSTLIVCWAPLLTLTSQVKAASDFHQIRLRPSTIWRARWPGADWSTTALCGPPVSTASPKQR